MKKIYLQIIVWLILPCIGFGQQNGVDTLILYNANNYQDGGDAVARDCIIIEPGFTFEAAAKKSFIAEIDETITLPVHYEENPNTNPENRDLTNKEVGAIAGSIDVSPTGAATYQIPIDIPSGTAGMQPNISIVYNSQAGNGMLGLKWDIAGLSAITRTGQTIYHDGKVSPVSLSYEDRFLLDGNRLIVTDDGDYGAANTTYGTEQEAFSQITSKGKSGNGPQYFKVETKDGMTLYYGHTEDSRIKVSGRTTVFMWRLNRVEDANGNYMTYTYEQEDGESWIQKIEYTGNASAALDTYNSITFMYEKRSDINNAYVAGKEIKSTLLLSAIKVRNEGNNIRQYGFRYIHDDFHSKLYEVTEKGSDGSEVNSTIVNWGFGGYSWLRELQPESSVPDPDCINDFFFLDLNGNGRQDMLVTTKFGTHYSEEEQENARNCIVFLAPPNISGETYQDISFIQLSENFKDIYISKPDAAGKQSFFIKEKTTVNSKTRYTLKKYYLNSNASLQQGNSITVDFSDKSDVNNISFASGNFWGQGTVCDLIARNKSSSNPKLKLADINDSRFNSIADTAEFSQFLFLDFDGDGVDELMLIFETGSAIYKYNQSTEDIERVFYDEEFLTEYYTVFPVDFNGDGKMDLLARRYNRSNGTYRWFIHMSTGIEFTQDSDKYPIPSFTSNPAERLYEDDKMYILDVNGDGKTDIVIRNDAENKKIKYYFSMGNGAFNQKEETIPFAYEIAYNKKFVDVFGLGCFGILVGNLESSRSDLSVKGDFFYHGIRRNNAHYVDHIVDGMNNKYQIEYTPLSKGGDFYTKGNLAGTFTGISVMNYQGSLYAVSKMTTPDGIDGLLTTDYSYKDARIHYTGKGFLGFKEITAINSTLGRKQISTYKYDINVFDVHLHKSEMLTSDDDPITTTTYTQDVQDLGGKRYFPYTSSVVQTDELNDITVTTDYTYHNSASNLGNLQYQITKYGSVYTDTVKYFYTKPSGFGSWSYNNRIERQETVSKHADDNGKYNRFVRFEYDAKGNLKKKIEDTGITTAYSELNACGLATKQTVSASGYANVETNFVYDDNNRFVVNVSNELGETSKTYNAMGQLLSETDAIGQTAQYRYDGFGRLVKTIVPEGHTITTSYLWRSGGGSAASRYYTLTNAPGKPSVTTYYDAAGREIETQTDGLNGTIYVKTTYNNKGQVTKKTYPYYTAAACKEMIYEYDSYGRQSKVKDMGRSTTMSYGSGDNSYSVTVTTPDNKASTKYYNAHGDLVQATDNGGNVVYQYHASGQTKKITTNGAVFEMQYDALGRQTQLIDPDAGTTVYTYDVFGNLKTQKNARNQTTSCIYDKFQRLASKTLPAGEGTITYSYYADGFGKGQIRSIVGSGHSLSYDYGEYGRLASLTETIDGHTFTHRYDYDAYGNTTDITYPGGFQIKHEYNANGYLTDIRNGANNQPIWHLSEVTAQGQPKECGWGRGNSITYGYDNYFLPDTIQYSDIQLHTYDISSNTGNMGSRSCQNGTDATRTESFFYDNLDRLKRIERSEQPNFEMAYLPNGNIETKPDAGDYRYHAQKVHAVSTIENPSDLLLAMPHQEIDYTSFQKTKEIRDALRTNVYNRLQISYGVDQQRTKTTLYLENALTKTKYFSGSYEQIIDHVSGVARQINYIRTPFGPVAAYVQNESGGGSLYYLATDLLGSITAVVPAVGNNIEYRSYDAWGRPRNPDDWTYNNVAAFSLIDRGYTFHEHLPELGLINMNGRMYDPLVGRMLSPDPFVQFPDYSQSFNRYSYAMNNPLKFIDPSGNKLKWWQWALIGLGADVLTGGTISLTAAATATFATAAITTHAVNLTSFNITNATILLPIKHTVTSLDFFAGMIHSLDDNPDRMDNAWLIEVGMFLRIPGWEDTQTILGNTIAHFRNMIGQVDNVEFYKGSVLVNDNVSKSSRRWGFTLGPYINSQNIEYLVDDMFYHEYGHTRQSRILGPLYLIKVGLPSMITSNIASNEYHNNSWYEVWANHLAGVSESKEYPRKFRHNKLWYWSLIGFLTFWPY